MHFFHVSHKTLDNIKRLVDKENFEEAEKIISKHIEEQHYVDSDFNRIGEKIRSYETNLANLNDLLKNRESNEGKTDFILGVKIYRVIDNMKKDLGILRV